jgi:hypothetical protein
MAHRNLIYDSKIIIIILLISVIYGVSSSSSSACSISDSNKYSAMFFFSSPKNEVYYFGMCNENNKFIYLLGNGKHLVSELNLLRFSKIRKNVVCLETFL